MADHLSLRSRTSIGFAVLLLVAFLPLTGLAGGGAASFSCVSPTCQTGTASCLATINAPSCSTSTITFGTPYSNTPVISIINETFSVSPRGTATGNPISNNIVISSPSNTTTLFSDDETPVTMTIPNTDTIIKQFPTSPVALYGNFLIEGEGYITTSVASTKQVISITADECGGFAPPQFAVQTINFETESLAVGITPFAIKGLANGLTGSTGIFCGSIDVMAPAADANTSVTLVSLRIYGIEAGFRTWMNMPSALTHLYGSTLLDTKYDFVSAQGAGGTQSVNMCVNVENPSLSALATLKFYIDGVFTNLQVLVVAIGLQCNTVSITLPSTSGLHLVQIFGQNGNGVGDMPAFGSISITWHQTTSPLTVPIGYNWKILLLTATSFKIQIFWAGALGTQTTVTWIWQSVGS